MQYLRLVCATLTVIALGMFLGVPHQGETVITLPGAPSTSWFSPIQPVSLAAVLLLVAVAIVLTRISRRPVMIIMVPIFGGILIQASGHVALEVPPLASAAAFCVIGWYVGELAPVWAGQSGIAWEAWGYPLSICYA